MRKNFILIILFFCFACNTEKPSRLKKFYWLEGTWISKNGETVITETWKKNGEEMEGQSITVIGLDTVFTENIFLQEIDDTITYTAYLQKNAEGTAFKLKNIAGNETVFENPEHDFPQRIIYRKQGEDSLYAAIEGEQGGKFSKEEYFFKKVK